MARTYSPWAFPDFKPSARAVLPVFRITPIPVVYRESRFSPPDIELDRIALLATVRLRRLDLYYPLRRRAEQITSNGRQTSRFARCILALPNSEQINPLQYAPWHPRESRENAQTRIGAPMGRTKEQAAANFMAFQRTIPSSDIVIFLDGSRLADGRAGGSYIGLQAHYQFLRSSLSYGHRKEVFDVEAEAALAGSFQEIFKSFRTLAAAWPLRKRLPHTKSGSIQIRWVPGHAKIPENEVADLAAKEGAASTPPAPHKSSYASLKRHAKTQSLSAAQSQWQKKAEESVSILRNFDETGFIVGQGKDGAVVTAYPKTSKRVFSLSSRESITVIEGINAEGKIIPPLLIPKGKVHLEELYRHIKDDDWLVAPASNGFITDEIAFEWLQHFDHFSRPEAFPDWRLLLMDNHTTHLTIHFVQYCEIWHIRPFRFPPHSTHFLQPLDGPDEAFEALVAEGDALKIYGEADDIIPSSPTTKSISPPSTAVKLRRYVNEIEKSIDSIKDIPDEVSPGLSRRIKVVNQGSLTLAELGDLHRESFAKVRDTATRKNQKTTKRQVKVSGALYVKDANRLMKRRHDGDLLKIYKSHAVGVPQPTEEAASTEPQNSGFFFATQENK
ncbi:hypothetical protein TSTA_019730 [Talaromyces stipitatus ATCC 10500]|uniref:DDE-1 domain-containing protein n=1 Tax=Talaromyces stipitatus (strain ATCC 10500 / CBS 375.48 / QM 6759 / NRRL 1006) TaxID=441959 RepID=B8MEM9_TALSN|nr:uncharacterized protein TSTA_019730 [Talaromyces stipitatus ATCC 10500]EED16912.1 hypothetical protein TSTA_019730 [Talaromyces stipitatus ATCC 10500]